MLCETANLCHMAKESNEQRLQVLRQTFSDTASNVPEFTGTALQGGKRRDEGLDVLLGYERSLYEKTVLLKKAVVLFLDSGNQPSLEASRGDVEMQLDAALFYHFRVSVEGVRLFVKVLLDEDDPHDPDVTVISVKRDDKAWE